ncbi:ribokinase [Paenibacillus senegalimassiliensis]|uniref:ribokinase n=1 Tax=Paenibacillus senegalimassiliensis TaxID=1737426 RepID=UPI00073EB93F|nr:ribokinase [Paenibacillus senegalimassiliensis]
MKIPRIAVVGSLNQDLVVSSGRMPLPGETLTGESIHYIPGGKGANQAVACARLGAQVDMIGAVGDDTFGRSMLAELEGFGVSTSNVSQLTDTHTGVASIVHTPEDNSIIIVPGANGHVTAERVEQSAETIRQADILLVQLEIPLDGVEAALRIAREAGVPTILNPAPARELTPHILALADYFTPNETEFAFYSSSLQQQASQVESDWQAALNEWSRHYSHKVILTRGREGASYLQNDQPMTIPAPMVKAVDTTGAGDCLNGALGFGLASGWSLEQSLAFAVRAASLSVMKFGAQAGMPSLKEVQL